MFKDRSFNPFNDSRNLQVKSSVISVCWLSVKYLCSFRQFIVNDKFVCDLEYFEFFLLTGLLNIIVLLYMNTLFRMKHFSSRSFYLSNPDKDPFSSAIDNESILKEYEVL